ncbi:MAG: MMPL family transporter, partial [Spirochaetaceae bacterium]|nr:MMPL family transporter [Spirochaetaceae bacterium]
EPTSAASGFELGGFGSDDGFATNGFAADDEVAWGFGSSWAGDDSGTWGASEPIATVPLPAQSADVAELLTRAYALADRADISAFELIQLVNRELNYRGQAYYEIPYDPSRYPVETREELGNLISQYLLLYSGNMDDFADDALEPMQARMRVQLRSTSARAVEPLIDEINAYAAATLPPGYTVTIAGIAVVENAVTSLITDAQIRSIIVSLSLVFVIVAFTFRSFVAGLYSIVPLGLTLLINFAIMGFAGITLDVATAMVSSVAIGIGIDYTIHFLSGYKRERLRHATVPEAERATLRTTGRAITFNAVSVAAGFAVLIFSRFNPLMNMGILIALTMVTSSIASMTILPALLDLFRPRFISTSGVSACITEQGSSASLPSWWPASSRSPPRGLSLVAK